MAKDRTQLTIEQRRDIFLAAVQIEEDSLLSNKRSTSGESIPYSDDRMDWKHWQIEFFGCIPGIIEDENDDARWILQAHYKRPLSETRTSKGKALTLLIRGLWREARKKKILYQGLSIAERI